VLDVRRRAGNRLLAYQFGSSLLEVLVAILVMSFGLLALGGLSASAQQYVKMSQFQSIAMQLASQLGERMRGNVEAFERGSYNKTTAYAAYSTGTLTASTCAASSCTSAEIAAIDMTAWTAELRNRLPGGDAFVRRDPVNLLTTDIWILWIDPGSLPGDHGELSVAAAADCPEEALSGLHAGDPMPRCMHYRISL
jgi:type IV pilus assembly protein PilV